MKYDVAFNFKDLDTAIRVRNMVRKIADINASTNTSDIFELDEKLNYLCANQTMIAQLNSNQAHALDLILDLFKGIDPDECNDAFDVSKDFKKIIAPSDVSRFIEVLRDNQLVQYLPNNGVQELFHDWCAQEELNVLAKDCMDLIVNTGNVAWKMVYVWLCNHDANSDTEVEKEMEKFREAICQRAQDS